MQKIAPKMALTIGVVVIFSFWGYHKYENHREQIEQFVRYNWPAKPAPAVAATPKVSELSVKVFADVNEGLVASCANNQLGLTREDCLQTVHDRKDICQQQTVQSFPDTVASSTVLQEVISRHVACVFRSTSSKAD